MKNAATTNTTTRIRVFGATGVDGVDGPISVGGPRQRRLLALLTVRAGVVVTMDWLAEYLWTDEHRPKATAPAIRTYMSRLRQSLPEEVREWIETEPSGYRLVAPTDAVEHRHIAALRAEATRARDRDDPQAALERLDAALALWKGDPFPELEDLDWALAEIERLRLDRLEMMEERWEAALALGRHTQITGELAAFTSEHGLRDRAARQLALALHRSGRTAEGLRVLDDHRRHLADESGLDPSPAVVELEQQLLTGDPSLDVAKVGRPLRGYRLIEEAGTGAFSVVWRGEQPSVGREVAIKQIRAELASQPEFIRRFEAEAHLVARIEHPHIVPLIDYWRDPDSAYLVMRWLRGGTLEQRLDDGPLTLDETLQLARQVGGALATAHAHGIVHRDVKTANILFDEQGNAFLSDFGIALTAAQSSGPEAALSPGSPAYASPEQIRRERLGPEADVFSLGVLLYECLTGSLPFGDVSSVPELIERQLHDPYPSLAELRVDVPPSVADAIAQAVAKDPADRFTTIEEFLTALEGTSSVHVTEREQMAPAGPIENPYQGLRAFDDGDADRFFGREHLTSELVARFADSGVASRCVVVVGPSGSGKSSVVRAGLVPALRSGAVEGSSDWFTTTMVPGDDPFEALEAALLRIAVNPPPSLLEQLRDGPRGILRSVRRSLPGDGDRALVVIDQFEELFTGSSQQDANDFLDALSVAVGDPTTPLRLAITVRADYYDRPLEHPAFARVVKESAVEVTPLAGDELERAIVEPARRVGVEYEPGLVARIAAETVGQPSPLPLLQYTLSELFDRRSERELTVAAYDDIGGLSGALAARAEALHSAADDGQRDAIRRVFGRLTDPGEETADLRRRAPLADLGDDDAGAWVIERFGAARLLTFDRDVATREPTVEVAHEALLREWPRLVDWLDEDRDVLRTAHAIAGAATTWDRGGRQESDLFRGSRLAGAVDLVLEAPDRLRAVDVNFIEASRSAAESERVQEQHRVRRLRRLVAGVAIALVLALVAGAFAVVQQRRADDEARDAEAAAVAAEEQTRIAQEQTANAEAATAQADLATVVSRSAALSTDNPEVSILLALEAHRRAPGPETEQAVLNALGSSSIPNRLSTLPPIFDPEGPCIAPTADPDGTTEYAVRDGVMISRDTLTGVVREHGTPPEPCVRWAGNEAVGRRVALSEDGLRLWAGPWQGDWTFEREFDTRHVFMTETLLAEDRLGLIVVPSGPPEVKVLDIRTGEEILAGLTEGDALTSVAIGGSLLAVSFGELGREGGDGKTVVVDMTTGEIVFEILTPQPAASLEFDGRTGELVAGVYPRSIVTVDLGTQQITSSVETTSTSNIGDIGIRADGLIVASSGGQVEVVDRRAGPLGEVAELRDVQFAIVRPDGNVFVVNGAEDRAGVIDIGGNALIERTLAVDPFAHVAFNDGRAATVVTPVGTVAEVIDLATGERTVTELFTPDGDPLAPARVYPEADGLWAIGFDNVIARWRNGELVEWTDLGYEFDGGTRFGDRLAYLNELVEGDPEVASLIDLGPVGARVLYTVPAPDNSEALPSLEGGMHVFSTTGIMSTYDPSGELVGELDTGIAGIGLATMEPTTGILAVASADGMFIIDPATDEVVSVPDQATVSNLGFAQDGELLAITDSDGTIRLWDVERNTSAGVVWDGSGAVVGSPSWYDPATDTMWLAASGRILQVPLDPAVWVERACGVVGRDFTEDEWDRFVPGDERLQSACP